MTGDSWCARLDSVPATQRVALVCDAAIAVRVRVPSLTTLLRSTAAKTKLTLTDSHQPK